MDVQHNLEQNGSAFLLQDLQDLQSLPDGIDADESYPLQPRGRQKPPLVLWRLTLLVGDGIVLLLALVLFLLIAPLFNLGLHIELDDTTKWSIRLVWGGIALISWSIAVTILQAQEMRRASNRFKSPLLAVAALVMMLALWLLLIYPFIANRFTTYLAATLVFIAIAIPLLGAWRVVLADCMNLPRFRPHGVIIGTSTAGEAITSELLAAKRQAVSIQGYISEDKERGTYRGGLPILGGKGAIRHLVQQHLIDTIIIADAYHVTPALVHAAMDAVQFGVSVIPMTVVYENAFGKIPVENVEDHWYVSLPAEPEYIVSPLYLCWRKVMDIVFALCGLLVLLLALPIVGVLIALDSPGPIFYRQERLGYRGKKFAIYKFRSMRLDAEREGRAAWTSEHDPRITGIGRFMRATHLDELPQVLNVLRGEMSVIGPRPEREEFVKELEKTVPFYRCRLMVKPGLSGWAQVKYHYGRSDYDALVKLQYDLYYIKHQSFLLDVFILLKTVGEVFSLNGA